MFPLRRRSTPSRPSTRFAPGDPPQEFIESVGLAAGRVARACGIACTRIERIVAEEIGISDDTAIRLGRLFRTTPQFWMNLQQHYGLERAVAALRSALDAIVPVERAS